MQITLSFPQLLFKVCNKCEIEKSLSEFNNCRERKDGKFGSCRSCVKANFKPKSLDKAREHTAKYRKNNPEKISVSFKKWYNSNRDRILAVKRAYYKTPEGREYLKKKRASQPKSAKDRINANKRRRAKNKNPHQRIEKVLRDRFHKIIVRLKKGIKSCSWRDLIGCSMDDVKLHIEQQFTDGMTWDNHGNGDNKWNIDHIKPLKEFDLTDIEHQKIAFHYTNLRPLWFVDNMARNRKDFIEP